MSGPRAGHAKAGIREGDLRASPRRATGGSWEVIKEEPEAAEENTVLTEEPRPEYVRQLYSMLGPETAEYFLNPPPLEIRPRPEIQKMMKAMGDFVGAELLWTTIRAESHQRLQAIEPVGEKKAFLLDPVGQSQWMEKSAERRHLIRLIGRSAQRQQDRTSLLIANNTCPALPESCEEDFPAKFFSGTL
ncbi:hypothetical protein NDU88_008452 [Pleurodeles waltl]|uniref:Uncharacterized protein n=1 Tax=Pleurodeles waltl TaxID=8319 RepID=A0AAV7N7D4_PLEWA|nr:hypothetical protein NDU88_008452 [Pleurodeles waltl]